MTLRKIINSVAVDTGIMASGDTVANAIIEFKNVTNTGALSGRIKELTIVDPNASTGANLAGELWLFTSTVTPAAANAPHSISDADANLLEAVIPIVAANVYASALNSVAIVQALDIPFNIAAGTSLFGIWVTRATPTFTIGTVQVTLQVDS